jgi:hypothetical protein
MGEKCDSKKPKLALFERFFVLITLFLVGSIFYKTTRGENKYQPIAIHVVGAIEGGEKTVTLPFGATCGDALSQVIMTKEANLQRLPLDLVLRPNQTLVIPRKGVISIFVKGKKSELLLLPKGVSFRDLFKLFPDPKIQKKRRKLHDGEVVNLTRE